MTMNAIALHLTAAFSHRISTTHIEDGFERFHTLIARPIIYEAFCSAIAEGIRESLIEEPVRLPEGALRRHRRLDLTPKGLRQRAHELPNSANVPVGHRFNFRLLE